jgi:hypothetical protein
MGHTAGYAALGAQQVPCQLLNVAMGYEGDKESKRNQQPLRPSHI